MKKKINIVWLKRDLRTQDHRPFFEAERSDIPYLPIFLIEPELIHHPDTSLRHLQFQYLSLKNMEEKIKQPIDIFYGEAKSVFSYLLNTYQIKNLFSYQESGIALSYQRDKIIQQLCQENEIKWIEFQRDGVIRGLKQRKNWSMQWEQTMRSEIIINTFQSKKIFTEKHPFPIPNLLLKRLNQYPKQFQPAGEDYAWRYLDDFLKGRITRYSFDIGKPLESRKSCSRLSPYISWGNLSIRQIYQMVQKSSLSAKDKFHKKNYLSRLRWHCHFIQKFEMECSYEDTFLNRGYANLAYERNQTNVKMWENGRTGIPIIDANIRCLRATGWINFRSRALLVSFLSHHLLNDWRNGSYFLARNFLDYEPGIHFPQIQMQAGTTGINTLRIYNPIKQSKEKDPKGEFIKQWIPELRIIPEKFIHEPHLLSDLDLQLLGINELNYPKPIVDVEKTGKIAREKLWKFKRSEEVKIHKNPILNKHVENR
ncbi:MAG: hypothetical protein RJA76_833 [Bacteroidota bacterium]|jgi:deoxyribodipyrimidine photo-lyase